MVANEAPLVTSRSQPSPPGRSGGRLGAVTGDAEDHRFTAHGGNHGGQGVTVERRFAGRQPVRRAEQFIAAGQDRHPAGLSAATGRGRRPGRYRGLLASGRPAGPVAGVEIEPARRYSGSRPSHRHLVAVEGGSEVDGVGRRARRAVKIRVHWRADGAEAPPAWTAPISQDRRHRRHVGAQAACIAGAPSALARRAARFGEYPAQAIGEGDILARQGDVGDDRGARRVHRHQVAGQGLTQSKVPDLPPDLWRSRISEMTIARSPRHAFIAVSAARPPLRFHLGAG